MAAHLLETPTIGDRAWTDEPRLPSETRTAFNRRVLLDDPLQTSRDRAAVSGATVIGARGAPLTRTKRGINRPRCGPIGLDRPGSTRSLHPPMSENKTMTRPVTLFTGQWADMPVADLAAACAGWGFDGLELACWGDHFEVDRALADDAYCREQRQLLERHGLGCWALGAHLVGQAVCDRIDARHQSILPPEVWGDGEEEGVRRRAAERMKDTARAAARFGVTQVNGFTGSPIWHLLYSFPPNDSPRSSTATRRSPRRGRRSSTSSTPRASALAWRCTRRRSRTTS